MRNAVATGNEETRHAWVESALKYLPPGSRIPDAGAGEKRYRPFCARLVYLAQEVRRIPDVAKRYVRGRPCPWERLALQIVLGILARFSGRDGGSSELLHYGFHVLAKKKGNGVASGGSS